MIFIIVGCDLSFSLKRTIYILLHTKVIVSVCVLNPPYFSAHNFYTSPVILTCMKDSLM